MTVAELAAWGRALAVRPLAVEQPPQQAEELRSLAGLELAPVPQPAPGDEHPRRQPTRQAVAQWRALRRSHRVQQAQLRGLPPAQGAAPLQGQ